MTDERLNKMHDLEDRGGFQIVMTNAPTGYDYEGTVGETQVLPMTIRMGMNRGKPFRVVALDLREGGYYARYQRNRYLSGGYQVLTPEEVREWIRAGDILGLEGDHASQP